MLVLLTIAITSFGVGLSGAVMPGPLLAVTVSESTQRGFWAGPWLVVGHGILELALVLALMFGLAPYVNNGTVLTVIALAGSVVLIWMAIGMFRSIPKLTVDWTSSQEKQINPIIAGIVTSVANPYWTIWWATVGLTFLLASQDQRGWLGVGAFYVGHILSDLVWYAMVSGIVASGRRWLTDKVYRGLIGFCATFLVVMAGLFAWAGVMGKMFK